MNKTICNRCISDERLPGISFDSEGICNYCRIHETLEKQFPAGEAGKQRLRHIASEIIEAGRGKKYDCVIGVSGGCDSSYLVYIAKKELGLRPLAVHFDNTWNTNIATQNIYTVLKKLGVDLSTHVVNNREYDDIYKSFLKAGVKDIDTPTDIGLITTLYRAAEKEGVKYILDGHSFRTEGIVPTDFVYMDGKYIESVHQRYGSVPMKTFPNLKMGSWLKWMTINKIKRVRPLYYVEFQKEQVKKFLASEFGWEWYGGKHMENRFTVFALNYFLPKKFDIDIRVIEYSGLIRSGQMSRAHAVDEMKQPVVIEKEVLQLIEKRLGYSEQALEELVRTPKKTYRDFPTYKPFFERFRWFFWILYKTNFVPQSFYMKYTR